MKEPLELKDICKTVSADLKARRITQKRAGEMIGTSKQVIANQLSGKRRFSVNMAEKFSDKLGYSTDFLLYGKGPLYAPGKLIWHSRPGSMSALLGREDDPIMKAGMVYNRAALILEILNDKVAIECFEKAYEGDWKESDRLEKILIDRYSYNIPLMISNPNVTKAFRELRDLCRKIEVLSAKRLVLIEQKAALGEVILVDELVERFKERVIWIKERYKEEAKIKHPEISLDDYITNEEKDTLRKFLNGEE